ncbi:MAG: gfo/Idh/MocA family oxidoreductase [Alphaproteobacteria bacterium]|nr:gfo/Idh/MocA family oxidoreductase [Alphaproteobacteria bacterium]
MKVGIIGCGLIGKKRAQALQTLGAEIACVHDISGDAAQALAARTGAKVAKNAQEAFGKGVDAVIVATRHGDLAPLSLEAVRAGKHVLVEKPAGKSGHEIAALAAAAREHKRVVKVGYNHRFHPGLQAAQNILRAGTVGPIMFIRGRYGHGARLGYEKEWRCQKAVSGGGELIDQGSHLIDLAQWLMGPLRLDYAATPAMFWQADVEDNCFIALKGEAQQMAWLHASWTEWKNLFCFEIMGRDGKLTIDGLGGSYGTERLTLHRMLPQFGPPETSVWEYPGPDRSWELELQDFFAAIAQGSRACGDIEDALCNATLIDEIYRKTGR